MRSAWLWLCMHAAIASTNACAGRAHRSPPPTTANANPGELIDSTRLPAVFFQQRISARFGDRQLSFTAVLQSEAGVLSLLGMTPYGTRAFLLEQRGQRLTFTPYVDLALPFPPRFILLDVHRTFFRGLPGAPRSDGTHRVRSGDEWLIERWQGGRLWERSFKRRTGRAAGSIRIVYHGGMGPGPPPTLIDLYNDWLGYRLTIQTLAR